MSSDKANNRIAIINELINQYRYKLITTTDPTEQLRIEDEIKRLGNQLNQAKAEVATQNVATTATAPQTWERADLQRLQTILTKQDAFVVSPRPYLIDIGLPSGYVHSLSLTAHNPQALASEVMIKLVGYPALDLLVKHLLRVGLGSDDTEFLHGLIRKYGL